MGRTHRKRKKRQTFRELDFDLSKVIQLQKALRLKCPKTQINYFDDIGWGVRCKKKIDEGEVIIALPLHHLITAKVQCEVFDTLKVEDQSPQFILSLFLIYESHLKEQSRYFEYIESLPKSFTNPYFCSSHEVNLLPEYIKKEVIAQTVCINDFAKQLCLAVDHKSCPHCDENLKNIFTYEKFVWAWFIVNTRSVYYQDKEQTKSLALAPFLDLFNHSNNAATKLFIDFERRLYVLKTLISYQKFEQVFIKYGAHSNLKLFLEYGFILPDNDNDLIEFSFDEVLESVRKFDYNFGEITRLKYNFIKSKKLDQNLTKSTEFSWNFQRLVYILITNDKDLSKLQTKTYSNSFTSAEKNAIQKISEFASKKKFEDFQESFIKMEAVVDCTASFKLAKNLIKNYMKLLL